MRRPIYPANSPRRATSPRAGMRESDSRAENLSAGSFVDTRQAAELIGMSKRTLEKWRVEGNGPPFLKLGRRVLYSRADLKAWLLSRRRHSTSES